MKSKEKRNKKHKKSTFYDEKKSLLTFALMILTQRERGKKREL
jgi:hypothetical protein